MRFNPTRPAELCARTFCTFKGEFSSTSDGFHVGGTNPSRKLSGVREASMMSL